ncbi:MAG: hypothetical protein WD342_10480 [Verrucomicrobiales bacterium]
MKFASFVVLAVILPVFAALGETAGKTNVPPDPFGDLADVEQAPDYSMDVDRSRGAFTLDAEDGKYVAGSHFANWFWNLNLHRWGRYHVGLVYASSRPKLGVQVKVGDAAVLKGYAPRTNQLSNDDPLILGAAYLPEKGEHPVTLLTGDESNVPTFQVKGIRFSPAPESDPLGQSIDGTIELEAKSATTYSENMRYEPKEEKNCLGFWTEKEDWAEWVFDVSTPGTFEATIHYGCGSGNEGSEVAVLVNDQTLEFTVEDTGGFQEWKSVELGQVTLEHGGENKLAVVPLDKKAKAVMDIRKIVLTPVR